jgi:hypothetical protein
MIGLSMSKYTNLNRILGTVGSVFILIALCIIAITPIASGYETSIYGAYPWYFWGLIILCIIFGIIMLIHSTFGAKPQHLQGYIGGVIIVIAANLIILLLPIFRGYYISDAADEVSHLGWIKDIALTGHIGATDVYPISHIFAFQTSSITTLDPRFVIMILPSIFYLIYLAGIFLLSRTLSKKFGTVLLVLTFGLPLIFTSFNNEFLPTQFSLYLVPMILFLFFKRFSNQYLKYSVMFFTLLVLMVFVHPLGCLFLIGLFVLLSLSFIFHDLLLKRINIQVDRFSKNLFSPLIPASILIVLFFAWYHRFKMINESISNFFSWFINGGGVSPLAQVVQQGQNSHLNIFQVVHLIINTYGQVILFIILALIAICITGKKVLSKYKAPAIEEIYFSICFVILSLFYLTTLLGNFIVTGQTLRVFCWALFASILLNGIVFYDWISNLKNHMNFAFIILTILIISSSILGLFSEYNSPSQRTTGDQVTSASMEAMQWFYDNKGPLNTLYSDQIVYRAADYLYGTDSAKPSTLGNFLQVPNYLGYDTHGSIATYFDQNEYLVFTARDLESKKLFPNAGVYSWNDYEKLLSDPGADKIYSDGDTEIMEIFSTNKSK